MKQEIIETIRTINKIEKDNTEVNKKEKKTYSSLPILTNISYGRIILLTRYYIKRPKQVMVEI